MRMKHSAFMLLQTGLRDATAWPFITLDFCSSIVLSKTSTPPYGNTRRRSPGSDAAHLGRPLALAVGGKTHLCRGETQPTGSKKNSRKKNICNMGRGSICAERGFLMKYRLLTVQEGRGRAVWEAAYRSAAVQTHSSSAATDPRWFYCLYILRSVLKSAAHRSEIWDRWIRTAGRGLEGFIGRALVSVTPVNGHHMLAVICASCWICIGCMMWINYFL